MQGEILGVYWVAGLVVIIVEHRQRRREGTQCSEFYRCLSLDLGSQKSSQVTRLQAHFSPSTLREKLSFKGSRQSYRKVASQKKIRREAGEGPLRQETQTQSEERRQTVLFANSSVPPKSLFVLNLPGLDDGRGSRSGSRDVFNLQA